MNYSVKYISAKKLYDIQDIWMSLENGNDMTVFQSYQWYNMLLNYYIPEDTSNYLSFFAVVSHDDYPCMIAPLWVVKHTFRFLNKKGVYLLGRDSYSDYLNFIYNEFDGDAFDYLVAEIKNKFNVNHFVFEQIQESTAFYQYISKSPRYEVDDINEPCVSLSIPKSVEIYQNILSKSARQNLRTANNRLVKDGKQLVLCFDDRFVDKGKCLELRETKLSAKFSKVSRLRKYKYRFVNKLLFHFPRFVPIMVYSDSKVMTAKDECGNLRAFFHYVYDTKGQCVRVLSAGTDLEYARYSPGMILMHGFIKEIIDKGVVKVLDFTRGDEKYKYVLGGEEKHNHIVKLFSV